MLAAPAAVEVGAPPAPPPMTTPYWVNAAEEDSCVVELKYGIPPEFTVPPTVSGKLVDPAGHA